MADCINDNRHMQRFRCWQLSYSLTHDLHDSAFQSIYRLVVLAKLLYASSSWVGFTNATDRQKLQAFLNRSKRSGFCDSELDDFAYWM